MKNFKYIAPSLLTVILVLAFGEATARTYHRSCSARYEVTVYQVDGVPVNFSARAVRPGFSGRGKCGPYSRINDCRRRARDFCHTCMKEHWGNRNSTPSACTYYAGGVGVQSYGIHNLTTLLDSTACSVSDGVRIRYRVYRVTFGDKGCGGGTSKKMRELLGSNTTVCR